MTQDVRDLIAEARTIAKHSAVSLSEHADCLLRLADALEASLGERDAAVAAIERVRAVIDIHRSIEQHNEMVPVSDMADLIREPSSVDYLAALDGAPEPEWEYGLLNPQAPNGGKLQGGAHLISENREHIITQQRKGHPVIQAVRRRPAGPWLPVEGEKR